MDNIKTWFWYVFTPGGIYDGELLGEMEPGETEEHAMQVVASLARKYITEAYSEPRIMACIVAREAVYIDAPGELTHIGESIVFDRPIQL